MEGFSTITYKGKTIYYIDYTNVGNSKDKTMALVKYAMEYKRKASLHSILVIVNITNLQYDLEILRFFKAEGMKTDIYEKKVAVIGVEGLNKAGYIFVDGFVNPKRKIKKSLEEAMEWLVMN
jgi:hypothetical protein